MLTCCVLKLNWSECTNLSYCGGDWCWEPTLSSLSAIESSFLYLEEFVFTHMDRNSTWLPAGVYHYGGLLLPVLPGLRVMTGKYLCAAGCWWTHVTWLRLPLLLCVFLLNHLLVVLTLCSLVVVETGSWTCDVLSLTHLLTWFQFVELPIDSAIALDTLYAMALFKSCLFTEVVPENLTFMHIFLSIHLLL